MEGEPYVSVPNATFASWLIGLSALACGCLLLIGFLTPVAGVVVGLDVLGISISSLPFARAAMFDSPAAIVFGLTILLAVIGAGPGRFSVDARVFGRREIIIPLPNSSVEQ